MRCLRCDKVISQKDRFCKYCGNRVTPDAIQASRLREDERWHSQLASRIIATCEPASGRWGAHIYETDSFSEPVRSRPRGCPEWVDSKDWGRWFHEGLVVWDNTARQIGALSSLEAVQLLEALQANPDWKTTGIPVIERTHLVFPPDTVAKPLSRTKGDELPAPGELHREEWQAEERLRLTGLSADDFYTFLCQQESTLRRMVAEHEERGRKALQQVYELLLRPKNEHEARDIVLTGRPFDWQRRANNTFVAEVPPDRATVKLAEDGVWWLPVIEHPGHFKQDHRRFLKLEEALSWAEGEIPRWRREVEAEARQKAEAEMADLARIAALETQDLTPFWIEPAALEPPQITYRAYIELDCAPAKSETEEISFGEVWHFNKEYYPAEHLCAQLRLKPDQVDVQQLIPDFGLYQICSRATYPTAPLAAAQSQQIWDQSALLERFAEKKVERARFGYQEVETHYCVWLGRVEHKPWPPWDEAKSRPAHMQDRAMEEALSTALDINGYRKYFQIGFNLLSDEDLLWKLHHHRSRSPFAPPDLRVDSQQWLQDHPQTD